MKKRLLSLLLPVFALALTGTMFTSCGDEYYEVGADLATKYYVVKPNAWVLNSELQRYEYSFTGSDAGFIDWDLLEYGIIHASIVIPDDYFISLPFKDEFDTFFGYETTYRNITFTVEGYKPTTELEFKVSYLWRN